MRLQFRPYSKIEDMRVRLADLEKDYETIASWYQGYGQIAPPKSRFGKTVFMIDDLAAIGVLKTDSSYTFLEPLIGNPKADSEKRSNAVDLLITTAKAFCREIGREYVHVFSDNPAVTSRKNKFNFEEVHKATMFRSKL